MLRLYTLSKEDALPESDDAPESDDLPDSCDLPASQDEADGLAGLLRGIEAGETPIIAVHEAKSARTGFLDRLLPALRHQGVRSVLVSSPDSREIGLATLMDQVVGSVCADTGDRVERCFDALTSLTSAETRVALVIDDAHLLTDQSIRYLDLMASVVRSSHVPLLILLVGSLTIWERLPLTGGLAAENIARRVILDDPTSWPAPARTRMVKVPVAPVPPKRAWYALAACVGSFAVAGGCAAGLYLGGPLTSRALFARMMVTQASTIAALQSRASVLTVAALALPAAVARQVGASAQADTPHDAALFAVASEPTKAERPTAPPLPPESAGPAAANAPSPPVPKLASALVAEVANTGSEGAPRAPAIASLAEAAAEVPVKVLPVASASVTAPSMSPAVEAVLISRGDTLLSTGDITAARLMYGRAADAQSVAGALAMGMTFEPKMLAQIGVQGLPADTQRAEIWYQRAAALGSSDAARLLQRLRGEDAK